MSKLNIATITKDGLGKSDILRNIAQLGYDNDEKVATKILKDLKNQISDEEKIDIFSTLFPDINESMIRAKLGIKDISNIIQDEVEENKKNFSNAIQDSNIGEAVVEGFAESMQSATDSSPITETLAESFVPSESQIQEVVDEVKDTAIEMAEKAQETTRDAIENADKSNNKKGRKRFDDVTPEFFDDDWEDEYISKYTKKLQKEKQKKRNKAILRAKKSKRKDFNPDKIHKAFEAIDEGLSECGIAEYTDGTLVKETVDAYANAIAKLSEKERDAVLSTTKLTEAQRQQVVVVADELKTKREEIATNAISIVTTNADTNSKEGNITATTSNTVAEKIHSQAIVENTVEQVENKIATDSDTQSTVENTIKQNENNASIRANTNLIRENTIALCENQKEQNDNEFSGVNLDAVDSFLDAARGTSNANNKELEKTTKKVSKLSQAFASLKENVKGKWNALDVIGKFKLVGGVVGGVALATAAAYTAWKEYKQSLIETATEATEAWQSSQKSIEDYSEKYKELKTQLDSGNLSESETINIKKQILDVQQQIVEQYGTAANGLDLINGKLDTQLGKIKEISEAEARRLLRDADNGYQDAKKEMEDDRDYILGSIRFNSEYDSDSYKQAAKEIKALVDQYEQLSFGAEIQDLGANLIFEGTAEEADKVLQDFLNKLESIEKKFGKDAPDMIGTLINGVTENLSKNDDILEKYAENYKTYLELTLFKEGNYKEVTKYAEAISNYNEALLSGNEAKIHEAKQAYEEAKVAKDNFIKTQIKENGEDYSPLFGDFDAQVDTASEKYHEFVQRITDGEEQNRVYADQLKSMSLSSQDVRNALMTQGEQEGEVLAKKLADLYGVSSEDIAKNSTNLQEFLDILIKFGIVTDNLIDRGEDLEDSYPSLSDLLDTEAFKDTKEDLEKLAKSGELSEKTLESTKEYADLIEKAGLNAKEAKGQILDMLTQTDRTAALVQGVKNLDDAYEEFKKTGWVTAETIAALPEVFKELENYDLFASIAGNPNSTNAAVQDVFDKLVSEYLYHQEAFKNMLDASEEEVAIFCANLKDAGVSNAEEMVKDAQEKYQYYLDLISAAEQEYALHLEQEANNYADCLSDKDKMTEEFLRGTDSNTGKLINALEDAYQMDYDNWIELLKKKSKAQMAYDAMYTDYQAKMIAAGALAYTVTPDPVLYEAWMDAKNEVKLAQQEMANLAKDLVTKEYNSTGNYGNADYDGSSDLKEDLEKDKDSSEETFDWIETLLSRLQRTITNLGKTVDATYKKWSTRNSALSQQISKVNEEISAQQKAYNKYMSLAESVGLSKKYKDLVKQGRFNVETITDEKLSKQIEKFKDFYEKALVAEDAIIDLKGELASLAQTKFDNVVSEFDSQLSVLEHEISMLDGKISQVETKGYLVSAEYYKELEKLEQQNISTLQKEYDALTQSLAEAMKTGEIEKYSESWYEMTGSINEVEQAIQDANTSLLEYKNNIRELEWELFDKMQEMISDIQAESDFLRELMSDEKMHDENGGLTEYGQATLGLHAVSYNAYMKQSEQYAEEIEKINKEIAEDPNNQTLLERRQELLESQRDLILSAQDEKSAMKDLMSEGYDSLLSYMDELIEKRKEMLNLEKDYLDYQKEIEEHTKEISALEKRLQAFSGDTSEESKATIQQLKVQLEEARENLEETQYEKYLSDQEQMLDTLKTETEEWINQRLDNFDSLLADIITSTNENSESIKETLDSTANEVGITLSDKMDEIWSLEGDVVAEYNDAFSETLTTTNSILTEIKDYVAGMVENPEKESSNNTSSTGNTSSGTGNTSSNGNSSSTSSSSSTSKEESSSSKWGSWFVVKKYNGKKSRLDKENSIVDRLRFNDFDESFAARKTYFNAMGGSGTYTGSASQNNWMVKEMRSHGFAHGGTIGSIIKGTGEDGFVLARTGEEILSLEKIKQLQEVFNTMTPLASSLQNMPKVHPLLCNRGSYEINIGDIQMYGVNDPETFALQLKDNLLHNQSVKKIIQSDTLGIMSGKNSLSKFQY